jgi:hypothetical protein
MHGNVKMTGKLKRLESQESGHKVSEEPVHKKTVQPEVTNEELSPKKSKKHRIDSDESKEKPKKKNKN